MRISDWSSDVCSSDLLIAAMMAGLNNRVGALALADVRGALGFGLDDASWLTTVYSAGEVIAMPFSAWFAIRSEEHTSELQSLMRISYAVFCLKKKTKDKQFASHPTHQIHRDTQNATKRKH